MPEVVMPKMGDSMEEGTIVRWLKKVGDKVSEGDVIAEIQTEKASIEIPATDAGTLSEILVQENETVPVGTPIAVIGERKGGKAKGGGKAAAPAGGKQEQSPAESGPGTIGKEAPAPDNVAADLEGGSSPQAPTDATPSAQAPQQQAPSAGQAVPATNGGRVKASPLARKVAARHGVDLAGLTGTGPGGRIIEADVEEAMRRAPAAAPAAQPAVAAPSLAGTERRMSPIRKTIAKRLTESKQQVPHFYLTIEVDMRKAVSLRTEYNAGAADDRRITFNDIVLRACALALERHPAVNSRLEGDVIKTPATVNMGVAVPLEDGLIVPVIRDAQNKSVSQLGREVRQLAERARAGQLQPAEYSGGTFTVSNLGMYGITQFQAIINPPEAAILAVGAIRDVPIVDNGQIVPGKQMTLTISVDHRNVDGATAAQFLQEVKRLLESPMSLLG